MATGRQHILTIASGLMTAASGHAQSFVENFDSVSSLQSTGWFAINRSQPLGTPQGWFQGDTAKFTPQASTGYLGSDYHCVSTIGTISNWELTPVRTFNDGDSIQFWTRTVSPSTYADRLQVRLSAAGSSTNVGSASTDVGDFTQLLLDVNPQYQIEGVGYPEVWTQYTIVLSGLTGPTTGRLALRYFVELGGPSGPNSDYIGIDTFEYSVGGLHQGRCCITADGTCLVTTPITCTNSGGTYAGDGTTCQGFTCPQPPTGACCLADGQCRLIASAQCLGLGGAFRGNGTACAQAGCSLVFPSLEVPVGILDGSGSTGCGPVAVAQVIVPDNFTIAQTEAAFILFHPYQGDLTITLTKVGGPSAVLVDRPGVPASTYGFSADHYGAPEATEATYFRSSDSAAAIYDSPTVAAPGIVVVAGSWKPEAPLSVFNGLNSQGTWQLRVVDCAGGATGEVRHFSLLLNPTGAACYANCDGSTAPPVLNAIDFQCFLNLFAAADPRANCDGSAVPPVLNTNDFICFLNRFAAGCT